ncbi:hypothetical protein ACLOJK_018676, partial [Asimina triloba]
PNWPFSSLIRSTSCYSSLLFSLSIPLYSGFLEIEFNLNLMTVMDSCLDGMLPWTVSPCTAAAIYDHMVTAAVEGDGRRLLIFNGDVAATCLLEDHCRPSNLRTYCWLSIWWDPFAVYDCLLPTRDDAALFMIGEEEDDAAVVDLRYCCLHFFRAAAESAYAHRRPALLVTRSEGDEATLKLLPELMESSWIRDACLIAGALDGLDQALGASPSVVLAVEDEDAAVIAGATRTLLASARTRRIWKRRASSSFCSVLIIRSPLPEKVIGRQSWLSSLVEAMEHHKRCFLQYGFVF